MRVLCLLIFNIICFNGLGQQPLLRVFQPESVINQTAYGANTKAGHFVNAGDAKIYYEVYGSGQPIVILHGGIYGSSIEMASFIDKLKKSYKVIVPSTRGHGKSEIGQLPITYEKKANDVLAVINAATKDSVHILGFSDGAYTGYKVASLYPNKVKKLVAIGAGEQVPGLRKVVFPSVEDAFKTDEAYWNQQLGLMPEPKRLQEFWDAMANFYNSMTASKTLFNSIKCPVLVLSGELDKNATLSTVITAYNMIPNSQLSIIPNAGHTVFLENFPAVWESIAPFLKDDEQQTINLTNKNTEANLVSFSFSELDEDKVVKVAKDASVSAPDEPTFLKIKNLDFKDGTIEVKVLSRLLPNAPDFARGFIGIAFRIGEDNKKFESIYIRPTNGTSEDQLRRNHSVQYFSFPDYKFDTLRTLYPGKYETYADISLNKWITLKIKVKRKQALLYLDDNTEPTLVVNDLFLGKDQSGDIGLWVDVGTEGFFKDLKVINE